MPFRFEILGVLGMVTTLAGIWLQWNQHWKRSDAEEALKDGKLSPAGAARRIRTWRVLAPTLTIAGTLILGVAGAGLFLT
ncbi:hypothetical protein K0B96_12510 [Horticoccus luteus]|uniref:Uncharacterized protein n=1 Tax=Horticoccus luteus TaxID=2862869 RepID=A0A8F9XJ00_9BACT|nr:hypothetical protein [Horticoccus luteus]QYM78128.1 hypothetical protein K0B96_12510 [Horticoccus luteus]